MIPVLTSTNELIAYTGSALNALLFSRLAARHTKDMTKPMPVASDILIGGGDNPVVITAPIYRSGDAFPVSQNVFLKLGEGVDVDDFVRNNDVVDFREKLNVKTKTPG